jgi:hypothetical protein
MASADHLSKLDEAALFILPGKKNNEPVLQQNADEPGIPLTRDPPTMLRPPLVNATVLLPSASSNVWQEHR